MAWAECPCPVDEQPSGYHIYPDLGIFEVVNPKTGVVMPEGKPGRVGVHAPRRARSVVLRYRTGDYIDGGLVYDPCPYCGRNRTPPGRRISRSSEVKSMQLDKIKARSSISTNSNMCWTTLPTLAPGNSNCGKLNDDPMELDEIILHVHKANDVNEEKLRRELSNRFVERTEIQPTASFP